MTALFNMRHLAGSKGKNAFVRPIPQSLSTAAKYLLMASFACSMVNCGVPYERRLCTITGELKKMDHPVMLGPLKTQHPEKRSIGPIEAVINGDLSKTDVTILGDDENNSGSLKTEFEKSSPLRETMIESAPDALDYPISVQRISVWSYGFYWPVLPFIISVSNYEEELGLCGEIYENQTTNAPDASTGK
jgi:hypothetical protein